jgi:RsiW-degrading membrane proteinase PrsW (M82 family)
MEFLTFTLPAAVAPSLILLWIFHKQDRFPEPPAVVWKTFGLGVLTVFPVLLFAVPAVLILGAVSGKQAYLIGGGTAFFGAAIPEEICKFLVVYFYSRRHSQFDEPMDGLVYGAAASLGFATFENVIYVLGGGIGVAIARAFTAVPMHATMGAIMGYYVGAAHFDPQRKARYLFLALAAPIMLHGLYDFPLLTLLTKATAAELSEKDATEIMVLVLSALGVLVVAVVWAYSLARKVRRMQRAIVMAAPA